MSLSTDELNSVVNYDKMVAQFQKVVEQLQRDYVTQLSLRTTAGLSDVLNDPVGLHIQDTSTMLNTFPCLAADTR